MTFTSSRDTAKYAMQFDPAEGLTDQQYVNDCDINHIISRYQKTGVLPDARASLGQFMDLSDVKTDYDDRLLFLKDVNEAFMQQPSIVRAGFQNDAGLWLADVQQKLAAQEAASQTAQSVPIPEPQEAPEGASAPAAV